MKLLNSLKSLSWGLFSFGILASTSLYAADNSIDTRGHKIHIQGRIADDRYYGYGDLFSITLPSKSNTTEIEDFYAAPNIGGVAFFNQSGFLLKLEIDELIPEVTYLIANHPEIKEEVLDALFYEVLLPQLKTLVPRLQVLNEQKVTFANGQHALFAVIDMPETATLIDLETGRSLDSKRGFLLFFTEDNKELINLSMQDTISLIPSVAEAAKARLSERLLNHLIHYQSTFRMEAPSPVKSKFDDHKPLP